MRAEMPAGPEAKARRAAGRARHIVSAALALSLAAALSYGGYGAWAYWLRDRNVFDEFLYGRQANLLPDSLYKGLLSRKWAPEGFCGATDKLAVKMENDAREWDAYYCGDEWEQGWIVISLAEGYVDYTLFATAKGSDGREYYCSPRWRYDAATNTLSCTKVDYIEESEFGYTHMVSEEEFFRLTGWTRGDVEEWAEWTMWGFFVPGYFERNADTTRFSEGDLGDLRVEAPWLEGGGDEG